MNKTDRRTDMMKLIDVFRNFANERKEIGKIILRHSVLMY